MLKRLSRMERSRNVILLFFAFLLTGSLVIFYAPSQAVDPRGAGFGEEVVARVGRDRVTVSDLQVIKQLYERLFGSQFNPAQLGGDRERLNDLIRQHVITQEAERLGLGVTDAEVAGELRKTFRDQGGNFVGLERYKQAVAAQYGDVEKFERDTRDRIAARKLQAFLTASVHVPAAEIEANYKRENTSFDVTYVPVSADKLSAKIQPSEAELSSYYEAHKTDFRIMSPVKKILYIYIDQVKAGEKLQIPDEKLKEEYDKLSPERKLAGVKVQQIVLKIARADLDAVVKAKANDLVAKARTEKGTATEEEFAILAKGNSEDPATARKGGALSGLVRRNPNKPNDPLQRTLDMKAGEISEPIKYGNSYYIFRRGEDVPKTFDDAKKELIVSLRNRQSYAAAAQLATRVAEALKKEKDARSVAAKFASEANMAPAEMVRETPFIKPGDDVPEIGSAPQFEDAIAPLKSPNDVGDRVGVRGGFAIPMLTDYKDPGYLPTFEEVRSKVEQRVKDERAKSQLEKTARDLASAAASADALKTEAAKYGLEAQTASSYHVGSPLGENLDSSASSTPPVHSVLSEAIYRLQPGDITREPIKLSDTTYVVVAANKRVDADMAKYTEQRSDLIEREISTRRDQIFNDYVNEVVGRMKRDGKIRIYDSVLTRLVQESDAAP